MYKHVAIIGAGPAGCALACLLREREIQVTIFDNGKAPSLLVGESLIPAAIPIIRRLGIEQEVADISSIKRGAALRHGNGTRVNFKFQKFGREYPDYAYNIPRPQFDALIRRRAIKLGATVINHRAKLSSSNQNSNKQIELSATTMQAAGLGLGNEPDLIIDATGRSRLVSRTLRLAAQRGPRSDVAHFAHFDNFDSSAELEGQVVLSVLEHGWSWQIPLPGKTSVGVVIDMNAAEFYGTTAEERLENVIEQNSLLSAAGKNRQRVSPTMTYANYQLISQQAAGPGWLLLGDALGFVDPMLSPGVFMALESAALADKLIFAQKASTTENFLSHAERYFDEVKAWHSAWATLIDYFYDGRILTMGAQRNAIRANAGFSLSKIAEPLVSRALSQMVGGVATRSRFNQQALFHTCRHLIRSTEALAENRIQSGPSTAVNIAA